MIIDQFGFRVDAVLRSWFWNVVLTGIMVIMAGIVTSVAVSGINSGSVATVVIFGVMAVPLWIGTVRAVMLGVAILPDRIVARGLGRTTVIRWEEMERVEVVGLVNGAASLGGAITPVVYWKRPRDTETRQTELSMLGGYVLGPRRPTRMERQAAKIKAGLARWREQEPTSD